MWHAAGVDVGVQLAQIQRDLADGVRAVDHRQDARLTRAAADLRQREDQRGRAGDVAEEDDFRARRDARPEQLDELGLRGDRRRDVLPHEARAGAIAHVAPGALHRAVLVVGGQDFVPLAQPQRRSACRALAVARRVGVGQAAGDDVHGCRWVGEVDDVIGADADVLGQSRPAFDEQLSGASAQEADRFALQLKLEALTGLQHGPRRGAERAVVQKDDVGIEQELGFE